MTKDNIVRGGSSPPASRLHDIACTMNKYLDAEVVWVQDEPQNQGAWPFMALNLPQALAEFGETRQLRVVSSRSVRRMTGSTKKHQAEQQELIGTVRPLTSARAPLVEGPTDEDLTGPRHRLRGLPSCACPRGMPRGWHRRPQQNSPRQRGIPAPRACMPASKRTEQIVAVMADAFTDLMKADLLAFRTKFRKMAKDPHAFYRGSACLFYADVTAAKDEYVDDERAHLIHGDLHAENFGTYLNSDGRLRLRHQRLRRGLHRPLHLGPQAVRGQPGAARLAEGPAAMTCASTIRRYQAYSASLPLPAPRRRPRLRAAPRQHARAGPARPDEGPHDALGQPARQADHQDERGALPRTGPPAPPPRWAERRCVRRSTATSDDPKGQALDWDSSMTPSMSSARWLKTAAPVLPAYSILVEGYSQALDNDVVPR